MNGSDLNAEALEIIEQLFKKRVMLKMRLIYFAGDSGRWLVPILCSKAQTRTDSRRYAKTRMI